MGNRHGKKRKEDDLDYEAYYQKDEMPKYIHKYNILFIGEPGTGTKTSLIKRLKGGEYFEIMNEYKEKNEAIKHEVGENTEYICYLYLIDRNGKEEKSYLIDSEKKQKLYYHNYYKNADIIVMGYDVTNKQSFEEIKSFWYKIIKDLSKTNFIYLLGNKIDLKDNIEVNENDVKEFTEINKINHFLISVKNNININEFYNVIKMTIKDIPFNNYIYKTKKEIIYGHPSKERYKLIFLGDSLIGKTSLIRALNGFEFDPDFKNEELYSTSSKTIYLEGEGGIENKIILDIWDFSGKEKVTKYLQTFMYDLDCVILGYDITKMESFDNIKSYWYPLIKRNSDTDLIYLLGYKCDLYEDEEVIERIAKDYSKENNLRLFFTSAKNSFKEEFLNDLTKELIKK